MKSRACIYDNPDTMAREAWRDGKLLGHTTSALLLTKGFRGGSWWPFYFNIGDWEPGQIIGDATARELVESLRADRDG